MKRRLISATFMIVDILLISLAYFGALYIRFDGKVEHFYYQALLQHLPVIILVNLAVFYFFRLYHQMWRYASITEILTIPTAITLSSLFSDVYMYFSTPFLPRSIYIISWGMIIAFIGASRLLVRILHHRYEYQNGSCTRVLIVGAGDAGVMIAREIRHRYHHSKKLIGFIDDDRLKRNQIVFGVKVFGNRKVIESIALKYDIQEIIIAMPSASGKQLRRVLHECKKTGCMLKTVPGIYELIDGKVSVQQIRNINLEDLLRREPVKLDLEQIAGYLSGKRVLITGAGGSIGSELSRQVAAMAPNILILLGKGENSIYEIDRELKMKYPGLMIEPVIADVRDYDRINNIFNRFKPEVVFHAAAHKHVPLMELQPEEAVRNNIFGTKNVAEAASNHGVEKFVLISTDKAVNPTSVMGATKRVAELIIQNLNRKSKTKFMAVRFGNVLGSRGSVIPLFKQQIAYGGPITITHPEMKRYFMTIPEAAQLVLQAGSMANGGEVFVLDMGEPVKILDMAHDLIELSGLKPNVDIKIKFTGLRSGEKLFEELLTAEEGTAATKHKKIFVANLKEMNEQKLLNSLFSLQNLNNPDEIKRIISILVPTFNYHCQPGPTTSGTGNVTPIGKRASGVEY